MTIVPPKVELRNVAMQMLARHVVKRAVDAALEQRKDRLRRLRCVAVNEPIARILAVSVVSHIVSRKWSADAVFVCPIRWFDSSHALIAAEIVGVSICDCYGSFRAYKVELLSGKVIQEFDQAQVKKEFSSDLGPYLAEAPNNNWDRDPKSCKPRGP